MSQIKGINTKIQAWYETTFAVTPVTPATENIYFKSWTPSATIAQIVDPTMAGGLRGMPPAIQGNKDVTGTLNATLAPQSCAKMLAMVFGAPTITTIATAKQFVYNLTQALPVSLGFEMDFSAAMTASPGRFLRMMGARVNKGRFTFKPDGLVDVNYDIVAANFDWTQTTTIQASPTDYGHIGFSMFTAAILEGGGATAVVQQVDMSFDNQLDTSLYTIGGGGVRGALPEGFFDVSGTVTALFQDMTMLTKALANTQSSLSITLANGVADGTAGNESLNITIPNLLYKLASPPIPGPKGLLVKLDFKGNRPASGEITVSATLKAMRVAA